MPGAVMSPYRRLQCRRILVIQSVLTFPKHLLYPLFVRASKIIIEASYGLTAHIVSCSTAECYCYKFTHIQNSQSPVAVIHSVCPQCARARA